MFQGAFVILREKVRSVNYIDINIQSLTMQEIMTGEIRRLLAALYVLKMTR